LGFSDFAKDLPSFRSSKENDFRDDPADIVQVIVFHRGGCGSAICSLQVQKSPSPKFREVRQISYFISKGFFRLGMWEFESCKVGLAVARDHFRCKKFSGIGYSQLDSARDGNISARTTRQLTLGVCRRKWLRAE
jgi:hypothetical protein